MWPGQPVTAHWGVPDPASVTGTPEEVERAFLYVFVTMDRRIGLFLSLPLSSLDQLAIKERLIALVMSEPAKSDLPKTDWRKSLRSCWARHFCWLAWLAPESWRNVWRRAM